MGTGYRISSHWENSPVSKLTLKFQEENSEAEDVKISAKSGRPSFLISLLLQFQNSQLTKNVR